MAAGTYVLKRRDLATLRSPADVQLPLGHSPSQFGPPQSNAEEWPSFSLATSQTPGEQLEAGEVSKRADDRERVYEIRLTLRPSEPEESSLRAILPLLRDTLQRWHWKRGERATSVLVAIVAAADVHTSTSELFQKIRDHERTLAPILKKMEFTLLLYDSALVSRAPKRQQWPLTDQARSIALPTHIPSPEKASTDKLGRPMPIELAKASWAAPLLVVLMNVFLSSAQKSGSSAISATVVTAIGALLFLVGAVCGIAALFGIRKHGRQGILIPAILGISFSSVMIAVLVTNFFTAFERASDPQAQIEAAAASLRAGLPRMVDEETELLGISTETGVLIYSYRLVNVQSGELDLALFNEAMQADLEAQLCEPMNSIWQAGFSAISRYSTADHLPFSELVVNGEDCGTQ